MGFLHLGCSVMILYYCCKRNSKTPNGEKRSLPPLLVDKLTITTLKNQLVVFLTGIKSFPRFNSRERD